MRGADILVEMLIDYGVDTIFGVPGDTNVPLYEALQDREEKITHVMARDERSAGFMADAYGRFTDRPAVVECPSGAGAMYTLPPIAESNASSVPVIVMTIDIPLPGEGRGVLTELDCARLFEPVTKMSVQIKSAEKLPEIIRRAFRVATSGKPGAVHLQIITPLTAGVIALSITLAGLLQGTTGVGYGLIAGPVLALLEPSFVPAAILVTGLSVTALASLRELPSVNR